MHLETQETGNKLLERLLQEQTVPPSDCFMLKIPAVPPAIKKKCYTIIYICQPLLACCASLEIVQLSHPIFGHCLLFPPTLIHFLLKVFGALFYSLSIPTTLSHWHQSLASYSLIAS